MPEQGHNLCNNVCHNEDYNGNSPSSSRLLSCRKISGPSVMRGRQCRGTRRRPRSRELLEWCGVSEGSLLHLTDPRLWRWSPCRASLTVPPVPPWCWGPGPAPSRVLTATTLQHYNIPSCTDIQITFYLGGNINQKISFRKIIYIFLFSNINTA